ncbi:MAG TPA: molybdopterin cofactor-binding domain-containing protein, partial [Thermoanaerobaculia bacterium]|nr:molybdopterin cofactor-binding domain-containing protein [Thermoanaerobaculia bacterium]
MSASRRDFLRWSALAGAGLVIRVPMVAGKRVPGAPVRFVPNQWLRVGTDGRVTLIVARSEMGQGVRTCLAMILAEELEADWSSVSIEQASPTPLYEDMNTGGSDSVESSWLPLRRAAASARLMLVQAAAKVWKVEPGSCRAEKGGVVHIPSGRRLPYGRLAPIA